MKVDGVVLRPARLADALRIATVHHAAVHALAGGPYTADVLDRWAPEVSLVRAERLFREEQRGGAVTLVAEKAGEIVGFGIVAPADGELRACYVAPAAMGQGIGRGIVTGLELVAEGEGCRTLDVRASLNAVSFYEAQRYFEAQRLEYEFGDGVSMPVVRMLKTL